MSLLAERRNAMPSQRVRNAIIAVVTTVWAVNFGAGLLVPDYQADQSINAIFMAVVGGLFALGARSDRKEDDK